MKEDEKETFGDFDFGSALEFLNLFPYSKLAWEITPVAPSESLKINLKRAERQVTTGANEWDQRLFMELIFLEALENHNLRMWQEKQVDAGVAPFKGKADFVFTPYRANFTLPYVVLAEAKKDDFEKGWGQCLMAAKAAWMLNHQAGYDFDVYGIVSSGKIWEFGKYTVDNRFYKSDAYSLTQMDVLLGIFQVIFAECDQNTLSAFNGRVG